MPKLAPVPRLDVAAETEQVIASKEALIFFLNDFCAMNFIKHLS